MGSLKHLKKPDLVFFREVIGGVFDLDCTGFGCVRVRVTRGFPQPPSAPDLYFQYFCVFYIFYIFVFVIFFDIFVLALW